MSNLLRISSSLMLVAYPDTSEDFKEREKDIKEKLVSLGWKPYKLRGYTLTIGSNSVWLTFMKDLVSLGSNIAKTIIIPFGSEPAYPLAESINKKAREILGEKEPEIVKTFAENLAKKLENVYDFTTKVEGDVVLAKKILPGTKIGSTITVIYNFGTSTANFAYLSQDTRPLQLGVEKIVFTPAANQSVDFDFDLYANSSAMDKAVAKVTQVIAKHLNFYMGKAKKLDLEYDQKIVEQQKAQQARSNRQDAEEEYQEFKRRNLQKLKNKSFRDRLKRELEDGLI